MTTGSLNVDIAMEEGRPVLQATGSITTPLTDVYKTLDLTKSSVLKAINKLDEDDSDYDSDDDKCRSFEFKNLTKTLTPIPFSGRIVDVERKPLVKTKRSLDNSSCSYPAQYEVKLSTTETNSISSSWCCSQHKDTAFEIGYSALVTGSARMTFGNTLGESKEHTQAVTITAEDKVTVELQPGRAVDAVLSVDRSILTLRVNYYVEYDGKVEVDYPKHTRTYDLKRVLKKCKKRSQHKVTETIRVKFFTDAHVALHDV